MKSAAAGLRACSSRHCMAAARPAKHACDPRQGKHCPHLPSVLPAATQSGATAAHVSLHQVFPLLRKAFILVCRGCGMPWMLWNRQLPSARGRLRPVGGKRL